MMRKAFIMALVATLAAATSAAQTDLRRWDTGPLTWDDFRVVDTNIGAEHSYLEFYLDIEEEEGFDFGSSWSVLHAAAYMDKRLSWVNRKHCTTAELYYNQVLFDIVEWHRRRLQVVIDTGGNANMDYYMRLLEHEADSFCRSTQYGADLEAVKRWDAKGVRRLDSIGSIMKLAHDHARHKPRNIMPRAWEKGALTWNNFTPVPEGIGNEHSYLEYCIDIESRSHEIDGVLWRVKTAVAEVDKNGSWVDVHHRTDAELRYNQVMFNLAELYRRYLQVEIDTGGPADRDYYMQLLGHEVGRYCRQTRYGADTAAVSWWDIQVRSMMDSITPFMVEKHAEVMKIPDYRTTYNFGSSIGGGAKIYSGDLHRLFAPSGGFFSDFTGGYGRHCFTLGMYFGGGRCKPDTLEAVVGDNTLYATDDITTIDIGLNYGYSVIDSRRLQVTPFVGYGLQGVYYSDVDEMGGGPTEGCWRAGVDFRYHLVNDITGLQSSFEQYLVSVNGKIYVSRDRFNGIVGAPRGYTINLSLGFSLQYKEGVAKHKKTKTY